MQIDREQLIQQAKQAMQQAYAPYSHFQVGAALLARDGTVFTGCNIENATYGATNCAERTAFFKAVSQGYRDFVAIAIVGGPKGVIQKTCPPCGICRQVMAEFCSGDFLILLTDAEENRFCLRLNELLPHGFSGDAMQAGEK